MATSKVTYLGDFRCESEHLQSGTKILTDAPTDNHGKGEVFSPTDLFATSLAQCMLTTIAIHGKHKGIVIDGSYSEVQKIMNPNPRRIAEVVCNIYIKGNFTAEQKEWIEETGKNCPVALSYGSDVQQTITFIYE